MGSVLGLPGACFISAPQREKDFRDRFPFPASRFLPHSTAAVQQSQPAPINLLLSANQAGTSPDVVSTPPRAEEQGGKREAGSGQREARRATPNVPTRCART